MSLQTKLCVYLAIEAPISTFFVDTGRVESVCSVNSQHEVRDSAKFCEHCGSAVVQQSIKEPTSSFSDFCKKEEVSPSEAFDALKEYGWDWKDDNGEESYTLNWKAVQMDESASYCDSDGKVMALGFVLASKYPKYEDVGKVLAYTPDVFSSSRMKALMEVAEVFQLKAEPKLYVQITYC